MTTDITFNVANFVAEITLNRPQKHNAITQEMAAALQEFCAGIDRDDKIRVVLLKGAGDKAFCSGSDLNSLAQYSTPWKFRNRVIYETVIRNI
jgi:enoyl-CoA hydratase